MKIAVLKRAAGYIAFSLSHPGLCGVADTESASIARLNDSLYDYCNFLSVPLPADVKPEKVFSGEEGDKGYRAYFPTDKRFLRKVGEVALQCAFSLKFAEEAISGNVAAKKVFDDFAKYSDDLFSGFGSGLIGGPSAAVESGAALDVLFDYCVAANVAARKIFSLCRAVGDGFFGIYV